MVSTSASANRVPVGSGPAQSRRSMLANVILPTLGKPESAAASVFAVVRQRGPVARDAIANLSGLSITTVNRQITALVDAQLLRERPDLAVAGAIGRPRIPVEANHNQFLTLGLHIGARCTSIVASDLLGRTLGGATVASMQGLITLLIATAIGFRPDFLYILPAIGFMILIALVFTALGTAIASVLEDMQGFQLIMNFLVMPMFFFSGSLFPLDSAPTALKVVAAIDPVTYGVDALRALMLNTSHYNPAFTISILAGITIILLGVASVLFSRMEL